MAVGSGLQIFSVHEAIISPLNLSFSSVWDYEPRFEIRELDSDVFELLLAYLYRGSFQERHCSIHWDEKSDVIKILELRRSILLFGCACKFGLTDLMAQAKKVIEKSVVRYQNFLSIAAQMYRAFPQDDLWFGEHVRAQTRCAVEADAGLAQEAWLIEIMRQETTPLVRHLFSAFTSAKELKQEKEAPKCQSGVLDCSSVVHRKEIIPCQSRAKHLQDLQNANGPWASCHQCHEERDELVTTGRAMVSVAFTTFWPSFRQELDMNVEHINKKRFRKRARQELRKILCSLPINAIILAIRGDIDYGKCPNQVEHLKKINGALPWETCQLCLQDREVMSRKIRETRIGEGLKPKDTSYISDFRWPPEFAQESSQNKSDRVLVSKTDDSALVKAQCNTNSQPVAMEAQSRHKPKAVHPTNEVDCINNDYSSGEALVSDDVAISPEVIRMCCEATQDYDVPEEKATGQLDKDSFEDTYDYVF